MSSWPFYFRNPRGSGIFVVSVGPPSTREELIVLGVMRRRRDGRIDLPDVYRIAFNIGRKGGVPRVSG